MLLRILGIVAYAFAQWLAVTVIARYFLHIRPPHSHVAMMVASLLIAQYSMRLWGNDARVLRAVVWIGFGAILYVSARVTWWWFTK